MTTGPTSAFATRMREIVNRTLDEKSCNEKQREGIMSCIFDA